MRQIAENFQWFVDLLKEVWSFISSTFDALLRVIDNLPQTMEFLLGGVLALPSIVTVFAAPTIAITVAYFVLNRRTGGND